MFSSCIIWTYIQTCNVLFGEMPRAVKFEWVIHMSGYGLLPQIYNFLCITILDQYQKLQNIRIIYCFSTRRWRGVGFTPATWRQNRCVIEPDLSVGYKKIAWTDPRCTPTASGRPYVYNGITPTLSAGAHARCHRHISICPELWGGSNSNKRYLIQYVSNFSLRIMQSYDFFSNKKKFHFLMQIFFSLTKVVKTWCLLCGRKCPLTP